MDLILIFKAIIMGMVEGITEFLPISSTGHLILADSLLNFWTKDKADLFIVVIQLGAISAVIYLYWGRLWRALMGLITGKDPERKNPRQLGISLIISTIPIMLIGLMFDKALKAALFNPTVVAISLIVGGIGIMNIMLVSVTERTREIGIRKAVGASNTNIVTQFVVESLLIGLTGGVIGVLCGIALAFIFGLSFSFMPVITPMTILIAGGLSLVVGVIFGIYPALRAASKDPIESLRLYR